MKTFPRVFIFLGLIGSMPYITHAGSEMHTSLLQIKEIKCEKSKDKISGSLTTGNDLGGANYKLKFSGIAAEVQVFCEVLEVLKKSGSYAALEVSGLKQLPNSATSTGNLKSISIEVPND